jgi:hypothetical protein
MRPPSKRKICTAALPRSLGFCLSREHGDPVAFLQRELNVELLSGFQAAFSAIAVRSDCASPRKARVVMPEVAADVALPSAKLVAVGNIAVRGLAEPVAVYSPPPDIAAVA